MHTLKRIPHLLLLLLAGSSAASFAAGEIAPKAGLWRYEVQAETSNMGKLPKTAFQHCLTAEDVKQGVWLQQGKQNEQGCKMEDIVRKGNTMSYTMKCPSMTAKTVLTVANESQFSGVSDTVVTANPPMKMKSSINGKHVGACPSK